MKTFTNTTSLTGPGPDFAQETYEKPTFPPAPCGIVEQMRMTQARMNRDMARYCGLRTIVDGDRIRSVWLDEESTVDAQVYYALDGNQARGTAGILDAVGMQQYLRRADRQG